jgi:hypothetical protein
LLLRNEPVPLLIFLPALCDVLVRGDPAAACHRSVGNRDEAAVVHLPDILDAVTVTHPTARLCDVLVGVAEKGARALARIEKLAQGAARRGDLLAQPIELNVALVAQDQTRGGVEHA